MKKNDGNAKSRSFIGMGLKMKDKTQHFSFSLIFGIFVFAVFVIGIGFAVFAVWILGRFGIITGDIEDSSIGLIVLLMSVISVIIGSGISFLLGKIPLKPINDLTNQMKRLAAGDFSTRLTFRGAWSNHPGFREMSVSFNKLAEELESTEMLRGDFINNFSHEFKTPIVSIAGLAKLVNKGNLTEEQRAKYLTAIEEESLRLAAMATNVLKLTKIENQAILSEVSCFNLSEQIRSCVLLLENKWESKDLELFLDFNEYEIEANEELLKEVWINLLDNAVKFTPHCGTVSVTIQESIGTISVTVSNTGSEISDENMKKIWKKFYQADESHASEGNGVGLAIVKRVVDLHGGEISVISGDGVTSFTVELPVK
jgi:signal transduction histidine kinase